MYRVNNIHFNYSLGDVLILCADCIKGFDIIFVSKLHFHCHVDYIYSQALKMLWPSHYIACNFSSLD